MRQTIKSARQNNRIDRQQSETESPGVDHVKTSLGHLLSGTITLSGSEDWQWERDIRPGEGDSSGGKA